MLIVCQEAATVPLPAWEKREFHSLLPVGRCTRGLCPVLLAGECSDSAQSVADTGWSHPGLHGFDSTLCAGSRATTLLLQPHLESRGGYLCQ